MRAEVVRSNVQAIGGGAAGVDGSVGVFEAEAMEELDFAEAMRRREAKAISNLKISDFK